ncbi:MAG: LamB/YcsF family protein [Devosia sp.]|nr:LamB/YcsF family protein [Devosia sp.]
MPGDEDLLGIVSSASIACGGHAGDDETMRRTVRAARDRGVAIGAHPGFADRENFGRRRLVLPPDELDAQLRGQVRSLVEIAEAEGATVRYLKLHGALANMAAEEPAVAALCFASVTGLVPDLAILAIDNSAQVEVAETMGYAVVREAYADRAYLPNGLLVPRSAPGAVLHDPADIAGRAVRLARAGELLAIDGSVIRTASRSLCIHGDTAEAVAIARAVRQALEDAGIGIASPY